MRTLRDFKIKTEYPVGVVNWTNEEGARFPISMVASGVWAGQIPIEKAYKLQEVGGGNATQQSELERIGYLGATPCDYKQGVPISAHFELHIEQGPILESTGGKIGVVEGVQAYKWFTIVVKGRDCHTGTTDFRNRSDALLTACRLIIHSHSAAISMNSLASTGILNLKPGSTNTVPGFVSFSLDIRSSSDKKLALLEEKLRSEFANIARGDKSMTKVMICKRGIDKVFDRISKKLPLGKSNQDFIASMKSNCEATKDLRKAYERLLLPVTKEEMNKLISRLGFEFMHASPTDGAWKRDNEKIEHGKVDLLLLAELRQHVFELFRKAEKWINNKRLTRGLFRGLPCTVEWQTDTVSPATRFDFDCISCVAHSASALFRDGVVAKSQTIVETECDVETEPTTETEKQTKSKDKSKPTKLIQRMISGAGHDSVYVSKRSPTAMIFVPCRDGVSHNPAEYCSQEDCGNGADVLLGAMLKYDTMRGRRYREKKALQSKVIQPEV